MHQKQQQYQELREKLLHLINESPDSPEAEKWKNMLKQMGMYASSEMNLKLIYSSVIIFRTLVLTGCKSSHCDLLHKPSLHVKSDL